MANGLGARLAAARKKRNVTQPQLAAILKVRQSTVSMFESGELRNISSDLADRIRQWIASGQGAKTPAPRGAYK